MVHFLVASLEYYDSNEIDYFYQLWILITCSNVLYFPNSWNSGRTSMIERSCPKGTGIIGLTNKFNQFDKGYYSQLCTCFRSMEPRPHFRVNLMTLAGY